MTSDEEWARIRRWSIIGFVCSGLGIILGAAGLIVRILSS